MKLFSFKAFKSRQTKRLWLDLGEPGSLIDAKGPHEQWQDHGMGLLRTILHQNDLFTDMISTRACSSWDQIGKGMRGYEMLLMNVRSYTFPIARRAAKLFREINPKGIVIAGGMHASVAPDEMSSVMEFDRICRGPGEKIITDLVREPGSFPREIEGSGAHSMAEWPMIDRQLWPKPGSRRLRKNFNWPLEPACGWGPPPVATILTSRVCPWHCAFCNESSYIPPAQRRPVEMVIDELNYLDRKFGPVGSVVIHDSLFFQNRTWLEEWLEKYPVKARKPWPYWAAARPDTVRKSPDLFESLVRETNWTTVSIGFESGSNRVLKILNKGCSEDDNSFVIDLVNRIGDDLAQRGKQPPVFWANIILGIPGERDEDAFKTMRMIKHMKRVMPSIAFFAPYPGSILGYQITAEGKSLMTNENYHRFPHDEKVKDVDYAFYHNLLAGRYDHEIDSVSSESRTESSDGPGAGSLPPSRIYVFGMTNGKKKFAYGRSPEDALDILESRLGEKEMSGIIREEYFSVPPQDIRKHVPDLG